MTIPLTVNDKKFTVTILDNYHKEDGRPKVLLHKVFASEQEARSWVSNFKNNPCVSLNQDQVFHGDDIHILIEKVDEILQDDIGAF